MAKYIHSAVGEVNLEVVKQVGGNGILNIRLSNNEFELNRSLSENQVYNLYRDLKRFYEHYQVTKHYVAKITFYGINDCVNKKVYYFLSNIRNLKFGDYVFVDSAGTHSVGKFVGYEINSSFNPTKYIIKKATPVTTYV